MSYLAWVTYVYHFPHSGVEIRATAKLKPTNTITTCLSAIAQFVDDLDVGDVDRVVIQQDDEDE